MEIARLSILGTVIWIGLFVGGPTAAERTNPNREQISAGQATSEPVTAELEPGTAKSSETASESILGTTGPDLSCDEAVCFHGGVYGPCPLGPCCEVCGEGNCCPPNWYTEQGVRIIARGRPRNIALSFERRAQTVTVDGNPQTTEILETRMHTRSVNPDIGPGYYMTLGRYLGRDSDNRDLFVEFSYWGLNNWLETNTVVSDQGLFTGPGDETYAAGNMFSAFRPKSIVVDFAFDDWPIGGFNRAEEHSIVYQSQIHSFEINGRIRPRTRADRLVLHPNGRWRRECQPGDYLSYVFGLRVISLNERFDWNSRGDVTRLPAGSPNTVTQEVTGDYVSRTHNNMIGLQFGGDWIHRKCKWTWGTRAKIGPFMNYTDNFLRAVNDAAFDPNSLIALDFSRATRKNGASLVGEFGLLATYKISPHLTLHAAYDFMWITGLALAPEQLRFEPDPPNLVNDNGHLYFHGLTLTAECLW